MLKSMSSNDNRKGDRHKGKAMQLRLHEKLREQLQKLVDRNASTLTSEITIAVRERLQREGLWPPPEEPKETP